MSKKHPGNAGRAWMHKEIGGEWCAVARKWRGMYCKVMQITALGETALAWFPSPTAAVGRLARGEVAENGGCQCSPCQPSKFPETADDLYLV